jgi:aminomethyltransferase
VAGSYELTHDREYHAIRSAAAIIDVSPLFKYSITGPDAEPFLNRVVTRNVTTCAVGQVLYTPWCDPRGKVIDDGTLARLEPTAFRLTAAEPNLRWLTENAVGYDVSIQDVSDALAALAIQGPSSRAVLERATGHELGGLPYYRLTQSTVGNIPVTVSRTGYTGDLGYEVWVEARHAERLWDAVTEAGGPYGVATAGMLALDMARIEAGLLLITVDYHSALNAMIDAQTSTPDELGLGWTVKLDKGDFVGREALLAERRLGSAWSFRGLEIQWESLEQAWATVGLPPHVPHTAWRTSVPVYAEHRQVGYATSGCWSPTLKKYIALAHLQRSHAQLDSTLDMEITVEHRRRRARARVVPVCFFNPERKRA